MKIIVSHDVDHYCLSDHYFKDLYLQKFIIKNSIYLLRGDLSLKSWKRRMSLFKSNSMSYINELMEFNDAYGVEPVFFIGYDNALNLSYSNKIAMMLTKYLFSRGVDIYPHGIAYNEKMDMKNEINLWKSALGDQIMIYGVRMHYLRSTNKTDSICAELGYSFVSNHFGLGDPIQSAGIIHFPIALMDVYSLTYDEEDASKAIVESIKIMDQAKANGQKYFTIIFHDHHYCNVFSQHKDWYEAIIKYAANKFEFTTFAKAINEINSQQR